MATDATSAQDRTQGASDGRAAQPARRKGMTRTVRRGLAIGAVVGVLVSCSGGSGGTGPVTATLKEWEIALSSTTHSSGAVTFNITNNGDKEHEFVVRKTTLAADKLPLNADGEVSEDAPELTEVGDPSELAEIKPASSNNTLTVTLQPGHYVIFCNLHVEELLHYQKGMHVDFTVS
jgi:uncharacterized cupredoxin-like copper-binding protein